MPLIKGTLTLNTASCEHSEVVGGGHYHRRLPHSSYALWVLYVSLGSSALEGKCPSNNYTEDSPRLLHNKYSTATQLDCISETKRLKVKRSKKQRWHHFWYKGDPTMWTHRNIVNATYFFIPVLSGNFFTLRTRTRRLFKVESHIMSCSSTENLSPST